jgi:WD40 repeat protein
MVVDRSFQSLWTVGSWDDPVGGSCIGSSHLSKGKPNQDSYLLEQWDERGATFAAISDGHGDEKYWRSDVGSKLAVQGFKELLQEQFLPLIRDPDQDPEKLRGGWETIGKSLRTRWLQLCAEHLHGTPFSAEENARIVNEHRQLIRRPIIAYGATLSGSLLFQDYGFFLHLGDGDLLGIDPNGKIETLFEEPEVKANDTASLCQQKGHRKIRTRIVAGEEWRNSQMIVLATDGVGDAFGTEDAFHAHMSKYQKSWREKGRGALAPGVIQNELPRFSGLQASGDDSTILILKRIEKEDHLTRSEFERAWCDFEDKSRTSEAESLRKIQQTGSEIDSRVLTEAQQTIAALQQEKQSASNQLKGYEQRAHQQLKELKENAHNLLTMESRVQQLEQSWKQRIQMESKLKTILNYSVKVLLAALIVWILSVFIMSFFPSTDEQNPAPAPASSEQGNSGVPAEEGKLTSNVSGSSPEDSTASHSSTTSPTVIKPKPAEFKHAGDVRTVAFDPEGNRYASGSFDHTIIIWDAVTGQGKKTLKGHKEKVNSVSWSPDGKRLASGSAGGEVFIWTVETDNKRDLPRTDSDAFTSLSWSPHGQGLAIGDEAGKVQIWDEATDSLENQEEHQHEGSVWSVSWNPGDQKKGILASAGQDGEVKVTSAISGAIWKVSNPEKPPTQMGAVNAVAWSPDGTRLATGSKNGRIEIFKIAKERESELVFEQVLLGHNNSVYCVCWSPDGKRLASGSSEGTLRIWNADTGKPFSSPRKESGAIHSISWSRVVNKLIYSVGKEVKEYPLQTPGSPNSTAGEGEQTLKGETKPVDTGGDETTPGEPKPDETAPPGPTPGESGGGDSPPPSPKPDENRLGVGAVDSQRRTIPPGHGVRVVSLTG